MHTRKLTAICIAGTDDVTLVTQLKNTGLFEIKSHTNRVDDAIRIIKKIIPDVIFIETNGANESFFKILQRLKESTKPLPPIICFANSRDYEEIKIIHNRFKNEIDYVIDQLFFSEWNLRKEDLLQVLESKITRNKGNVLTQLDLIHIYKEGKSTFISHHNIIEIKVGNKQEGRSVISTENGEHIYNNTLSNTLRELPPYFIRINRHTAINLKWVEYIDHSNKEVVLKNGSVVSIGLPYFRPLKESMGAQ